MGISGEKQTKVSLAGLVINFNSGSLRSSLVNRGTTKGTTIEKGRGQFEDQDHTVIAGELLLSFIPSPTPHLFQQAPQSQIACRIQLKKPSQTSPTLRYTHRNTTRTMNSEPTTPVRVPKAAGTYTPSTQDPELRSEINSILIKEGHVSKYAHLVLSF